MECELWTAFMSHRGLEIVMTQPAHVMTSRNYDHGRHHVTSPDLMTHHINRKNHGNNDARRDVSPHVTVTLR